MCSVTDSNSEQTDMLDLIVIGAGFCGSVIGIKAHQMGLKVRVLDSHETYPDHFRAEKLETVQTDALASLGLIDRVRPTTSKWISRVHTFAGEKESVNTHDKHRGIHYADTINSLRELLRESDLLNIGRVTNIEDGAQSCRVSNDDGLFMESRLVVLATGMDAVLRKSLGLNSIAKNKLVSTTFGFDIESTAPEGFRHTAFNFRPDKFFRGLHYVTFFPVGERMRANLFTFWDPGSDPVRSFKTDPTQGLLTHFPSLENQVGSFRISSNVENYTTRYYRVNTEHLQSVVLVGDAYQSVNPANGVGISKCLTDIQVLLEKLPNLLDERSRRAALDDFYRDRRKLDTDREGVRRWRWAYESATSQSLLTRLKRFRIGASARIRNQVRAHRQRRNKSRK